MTTLRALLLLLGTLGAAACADYLIDTVPPPPGGGDGGTVLLDGQLPGPDGGTGPGLDAGEPLAPDTGFTTSCNTEYRKVEDKPLDLLVVLDVSYSMDFDQKWLGVKSAMKSFVANPQFDHLGVGLQYFPLRAQCSIDAYRVPAVPIGILRGTPDVAPIISDNLDLQQMNGGTPTVQVLEGASAYVKGWLAQHPDHRAVVVLATDGVPDATCRSVTGGLPNSLDNVLAVAREAASTEPAVKTFVIGVGRDLTALNRIAEAGGTGQALLVDTQVDADVAFLNALTQIRRDALGCEFAVPADGIGTAGEVDPRNAQVRFTPDFGPTELYWNVGDRHGCQSAPAGGWYFDDPERPTRLILCDQACTRVMQGRTGTLDVGFACKFTPT